MKIAKLILLPAALLACATVAVTASYAAPADTLALEESAASIAVAEDAEEAAAASAEASEEAQEAQAMAQSTHAKLKAKERRGYVYKIHFLKHMIANALAKKEELRALPATSKRRQVHLPQKREKLQTYRSRLREVRAELREKIYA
ncbi:MAG: hypothetical protein H0X28_05630 [Solirubrobacterales bacterium]|nr:hypothetical protein [Solirubrobacterales bacterium]